MGAGITLMIVGAVLAFAVRRETPGVDVQTVGVIFLTGATLAFLAGLTILGWTLALIVAVLAALAAVSGICVGCEIYLWFARRRGVELVA